jgi:hypothetical protein
MLKHLGLDMSKCFKKEVTTSFINKQIKLF